MEQVQDKFRVFKDDAVMILKIGVPFYNRMVMVLQDYIKDKSVEELTEAVKQIESKQITQEWVLHYETFIYFLKACEGYAIENELYQDLTKEEFDAYLKKNAPDPEEDSVEDTSELGS
jgi:hypothetical protein